MPIVIKHLFSGEVLLAVDAETLHGANLHGANLHGANLHGANLRGADLSEAGLSYANLCGANLRGANLCGANLHGADLSEADLHGAILSGANLSYADLRDANLHGANLCGANLYGANLWNCAGNGRELKTVQADIWQITYSAEAIQIGCQQHSIEAWDAFSDEEIAEMDREALEWWKVWKPILKQIIEVSPAKPTKTKEG